MYRGLSSKLKAISDDLELIQYTVDNCKLLEVKKYDNNLPVNNCK